MTFLYLGCANRRSTRTMMVLAILLEMTSPTRSLRWPRSEAADAAGGSEVVVVVSDITQELKWRINGVMECCFPAHQHSNTRTVRLVFMLGCASARCGFRCGRCRGARCAGEP